MVHALILRDAYDKEGLKQVVNHFRALSKSFEISALFNNIKLISIIEKFAHFKLK